MGEQRWNKKNMLRKFESEQLIRNQQLKSELTLGSLIIHNS